MKSLNGLKSVKNAILFSTLALLNINVYSQYYVKSKLDSTAIAIDSVVLTIDNPLGLIEWESAADSLTWKPIKTTGDSLWIRIDSSAYYRMKLSLENCDPVFSSPALVGFREIKVNGNSFIIEPIGGVYSFPSGLKFIVPPNAVDQNVPVTVTLLDSLNAMTKLPFDADTLKTFGIGLKLESTTADLLKPIRIRLPVKKYQYIDLPVIFRYYHTSDTWSRYAGDMTCSEIDGFVEYTSTSLFSSRVHLMQDVFSFSSSGGRIAEDKCKEGLIYIETSAHDFVGSYANTDCNVNTDRTSVAFLECSNNLSADALIQEIGKNCLPTVTSKVKDCLKNGESTTMTITVLIGGLPLEDQKISLSLPPGLTTTGTNFPVLTNDQGIASINLQCNVANFSGIINYAVDYKYYLNVIEISEGGASETQHRDPVIGRYEGSSTFRQCGYLSRIVVSTDCVEMFTNQSCNIYSDCYDQYGDPIDCGNIEYIVTESLPNTTIAISGSIITTQNPGIAHFIARSANIESSQIGISVGFQGSTYIHDYKDYEAGVYDIECGCPEELIGTPEFDYYKMTFDASLFFTIMPALNINNPPSPNMTGTALTSYDIESPVCFDNSFSDNIVCIQKSIGSTTKDIFDGNDFYVIFYYQNFRGDLISIAFNGKYSNNSITLYQSGAYIPEGCVGVIYDSQAQLN